MRSCQKLLLSQHSFPLTDQYKQVPAFFRVKCLQVLLEGLRMNDMVVDDFNDTHREKLVLY